MTLSTIFHNYFESELFYRDEPFIKNVSFVGPRKNVKYSKLVNNPFKDDCDVSRVCRAAHGHQSTR